MCRILLTWIVRTMITGNARQKVACCCQSYSIEAHVETFFRYFFFLLSTEIKICPELAESDWLSVQNF